MAYLTTVVPDWVCVLDGDLEGHILYRVRWMVMIDLDARTYSFSRCDRYEARVDAVLNSIEVARVIVGALDNIVHLWVEMELYNVSNLRRGRVR